MSQASLKLRAKRPVFLDTKNLSDDEIQTAVNTWAHAREYGAHLACSYCGSFCCDVYCG